MCRLYYFVLLDAEQVSRDVGTCQSEYLEQPPDELTCNPYINAELRLDCIVSVPNTGPLAGRLSVDWFHNPMLFGTPELTAENQLAINRLDDEQENITIREQTMVSTVSHHTRIRSRLEVRKLDKYDVGHYWCGIRIDTSEWMLLSDPLLLEQPSEYAVLEPCSTMVGQSKRERKCATWSFKTDPTSQPTSPAASELVTSFMAKTTTLEDKYAEPSSATLPLPADHEPTTTTQNTDDKLTTTEGESVEPLMGVAIGILVTFGVVILGLLALVICMCTKYRKIVRGRYIIVFTTEVMNSPN